MRVSDLSLHEKYGREIRNFDLAVWEREQEKIVLVGSYAKFAQNPAVRTHLLDTGDKFLKEAGLYDLTWGIRYKVDALPASQPPLWRGLNSLGKAMQNVQRLFRDRAPSPMRPRPWFLRAPRPLVDIAFSKLTLRRGSNCAQVTHLQPPSCRYIPTSLQTCHHTTAAMFSK